MIAKHQIWVVIWLVEKRSNFWTATFYTKYLFGFLIWILHLDRSLWFSFYFNKKSAIKKFSEARLFSKDGCLKKTELFWHFKGLPTGCFNSKPDVLKWSCDLDSELLVFWLSLVWSWVVEIYAWSTIWNFFDLRQPQQPQIKSVKIQSYFCTFFCPNFG